ncbi:hypothetical protein CRUP_010181 [Coryphaenoides rupestris]|nr:hypothetical protein CRUP_010181 [Coryphaenoides rupestris]
MAVGGASSADLEQVATDKSFVLSAPDFRTAASMGDQLRPYIVGVAQRTIVVQNEFTEAYEVGKRDIIFLLDSTMGATIIGAMREFIRRFVEHIPIGPDEVQIGVAQFSNAGRLEMDLNSHRSREDVTAALGRIKPRPGKTVNIGAALDFVRTNMFRADKGSRISQGVPQLLLVMTSKKSSDNVDTPAQALQQMGVLTLAAGTKAADEAELKQIAFDDTLVFMMNDFRHLLRNPKLIVSPLSTLSGVVVTEGPELEITTVHTPKVVRDIVFLVDGSSYVGNQNLPYVRQFITNIVNKLDVQPNRVQIGLMQFSERPKIEFYLNTHQNNQDVLNNLAFHVDDFQNMPELAEQIMQPLITVVGDTAVTDIIEETGSALKFMKETILSESNGSRAPQNVPQFLIVLTGGRSRDNVKESAVALKTGGVVPFGVGVKDADLRQIQEISHNPSFAFKVKEFSELDSVQQKLNTYVSLPKEQLQVVLDKELCS